MKPRIPAAITRRAATQEQRRTVTLDGVGEILLERSRRAKRINLTVRPFKGVRVAVPSRVSFKDALEVAQANVDWIRKQQSRLKPMEDLAYLAERPVMINRVVAREVIVQRLAELAHTHGFEYNKVFVRSQKTRWGSCSAKNNINLNLSLIRLPANLMDYVILHELAHTRIKNHGPDFWRALEELIPNAKKLDRELNRFEALLAI